MLSQGGERRKRSKKPEPTIVYRGSAPRKRGSSVRNSRQNLLVGMAAVSSLVVLSSLLLPWMVFLTNSIDTCPSLEFCPVMTGWNVISGRDYLVLLLHAHFTSGWALLDIVVSLFPLVVGLFVLIHCLLWSLNVRSAVFTRSLFIFLLAGIPCLAFEALSLAVIPMLLGSFVVVGAIYVCVLVYLRYCLGVRPSPRPGPLALSPPRLQS